MKISPCAFCRRDRRQIDYGGWSGWEVEMHSLCLYRTLRNRYRFNFKNPQWRILKISGAACGQNVSTLTPCKFRAHWICQNRSLSPSKLSVQIPWCFEQIALTVRSRWPRGLRHGSAGVGFWDCGFECRREHAFLYLVLYVGRGRWDRPLPRVKESSRALCVCVCFFVIRCNSKAVDLRWVGRRGQTQERKKERIT
jgi:hypothetical protein